MAIIPPSKEELELEAIKNLRIVLKTHAGMVFFRHLLREFDILGGPPAHLTGDELREEIAYRRYGASVIDYLNKADPLAVGQLMAELSREKHNEYVNKIEPVAENESDDDFK